MFTLFASASVSAISFNVTNHQLAIGLGVAAVLACLAGIVSSIVNRTTQEGWKEGICLLIVLSVGFVFGTYKWIKATTLSVAIHVNITTHMLAYVLGVAVVLALVAGIVNTIEKRATRRGWKTAIIIYVLLIPAVAYIVYLLVK